jgi:hypothetical protein
MRELIRHILKENRIQQSLKQVIENGDIFDAADLVGGITTLKKIFKDDPEMSSLFEKLTGTITFYYPVISYEDIKFPLDYEIIGRHSNIAKTNHWPEINVIYDENKLTPEENEDFKSMIKYLYDDAQHSAFRSKFEDSRMFNTNYFTVKELNGEDIDLIERGILSLTEAEELHDKLYGGNQSLNESDNRETDKNLRAINVLLSLVSWDGLCDIWAEYNPDDKEYEIQSNTTVDSDEIEKELNHLEDSIKSMGIKVYIFTPWYVENCDDEVKFMNESEEKQPKYLNIIKDIVEPYKNEDGVCDIKVTHDFGDEQFLDEGTYIIELNFGMKEVRKTTGTILGNSYIKDMRLEVIQTIRDFLPIKNFFVSTSLIPECGTKRWWDNSLNESSNKEKSLIKLIKKDGLYDLIEMTGLNFNQVRSLIKQMDNPKEILKQYIREFVLEHDGSGGSNYGSLFALNLPLSDTKYVNDILVQDSGQSAVEIWEYHLDEYGHREQKDQYLTSIITLTTEELLSILSWMMEVIEGATWY